MSIEAQGNTRPMRRTGWILSGIVIAFMAADVAGTLLANEPLKKATLESGYPLDLMWLIGQRAKAGSTEVTTETCAYRSEAAPAHLHRGRFPTSMIQGSESPQVTAKCK